MREESLTPAGKMIRYRQRLRDAGLRPIQFWLPDTRDTDFVVLLQHEVGLLNKAHEEDRLDFIEQASDFDGWQ